MTRALQRALRGLREHTYLAAVGTGVIAAALVLLGVYGLVVGALESVVSGWQQDVHLSAYFAPGVSAEDQAAAHSALAGRPEVSAVELVTSAQAAEWMKGEMPEVEPLLTELGESALPASLEVTLRAGHTSPAAMDTFAESLRATGRYAEIDYGREWVERAGGFLATLELLGFVLGGILVVASFFLVGNTINLVVYSRRDELEILRLVGATDRYILAPFLVEGVLQGLVGAGLALVVLKAVHALVLARLHQSIPLGFDERAGAFLGAGPIAGLVALGVAVGISASWLAVRRFLGRLA